MSAESKRSNGLSPGAAPPKAIIASPRVAASAEQRRKVAEMVCLVCGRAPVDPAHLVPQRLGGCGAADCVIPLCRTHHRLFDTGRLVLVPYLGPICERELRHALTHVGCAELEAALSGGGWQPPWSEEPFPTTRNGDRR